MFRTSIGLLIPALLMAVLAFGMSRFDYSVTTMPIQVLLTHGGGHAVPAGLFTYTDWDDHPHGWDHGYHGYGDRDWDHDHGGWHEHHWHRRYYRHYYHRYWGDDDDDDNGQWYGHVPYWYVYPNWFGDQDDHPGFYYFGWSFPQ